jgi:autotransporter translocation and assembly factor TamB
LQLGAHKLRFRDGVIGDVDVGVDVARGMGRAKIGLTGPMAERFAIAADVPLTADLSRGKFGTRQGGLHFAIDIKNFRLASLRPWIKGALAPHGTVDVQVAVDGPASKPDTKIAVRGRNLVIAKEAPATLDIEFEQKAGEDAKARVDLARLGGRLRINAPLLPMRVNLVDGGIKWRPEAEHEVTIVAREIDLWRQLTAVMPGHDFAGRIELEGRLSGPMTDPKLQLAVMGDNLRFQDGLIGKLRLDTHLEDHRAIVDLKVNGDVAKQVSVHAEAPLLVDLAKGKVNWLKDQPHLLDAHIRGVNLAGLKRLGLTAAWEGGVDVSAKMRGSASVPEFNVHTDLTEIVWKSRRVGTVRADVDYAKKQVKLGVDAQLGRGTVKVRGTAPLAVDLGRSEFKWDENGQHDVEIRVDQLDRTMLAPLGRVPEEALLELSLIARAKGNLADFAASLEAHGQMGHKLIGGAPVHISADILPRSQALKFSVGPHSWAGEIKVAVNSQADILGLVRKTAKADDIKFTASMRAPKFDTRFAQAFVPRDLYDVNGELKASIDATGTIGAPQVKGDLHMRRGSISVLQMQQRIRKIDFDVKADGRTIILEKFTAESGKGRVTASAKIDLPVGGGMKLAAETKLSRFPLVRPGLPQMQVDTQVKADMISNAEETDVKLRIGGTKVYVTGYTVDPPKQIPESPSVTFKDEKLRVAVATEEGPDGEVSAENEVKTPRRTSPRPASALRSTSS